MGTRRRFRVALLLILGLLGAIAPVGSLRAAPAADVDSNTYTSETFGYTITWDDSWFVAEQSNEFEVEYFVLTNGITFAAFQAFNAPLSVEGCLASMEASLVIDNGLTDIKDIVGDDGAAIRGVNGQHAYAAISGITALGEETTIELGLYLDCQSIVPGESLMTLVASMPRQLFDDQLPVIRTLLTRVALPGAAATESVFMSRRWRISIAAVARDNAIPLANLEPKDGKDWLVVIADVTNWSDQDATLRGSDLKLVFPDDRRYEFAPNSSRAAARELGLEVRDLETAVPIKAGETARIALVFLIPDDRDGPVLHGMVSEVGLPLDDGQGAEVLNDLPDPAEPTALQEVRVVDVIDGTTVVLEIVGEEEMVRARLIGVDEPDDASCAGDKLISWLTNMVDGPPAVPNRTYWIERDPSQEGVRSGAVYLWREESNGMRTLVNMEVVAKGYAEPRDRDEDATFAAWIGEAGRTARANDLGIWGHCRLASTVVPSETSAIERITVA